MRPDLVARRFVRLGGGGWLDLATGEPAVVCSVTGDAQVVREGLCRTLCEWSQPLIAPLLDFGELAEERWFDAWAVAPPIRAVDPRVVEGAIAWLRTHGWELGSDCLCGEHDRQSVVVPWPTIDALAADRHSATSQRSILPLAIALVEHPLTEELIGRIEDCTAPGPHVWPVDAPPGSGLRQFWRTLARRLRARGFCPVHAACFEAFLAGAAASERRGEPIVVLHEAPEWTAAARRALASLVVRLSLGASADVVLDVVRRGRPKPAPLALRGFDPVRLAEAVHVDPPAGLAREEIVRAAEDAQGLPGAFVRRLAWLASHRDGRGSPLAVHERAAPYGAGPQHSALERAARLERQGRRAAGLRVLRRSAAALTRRSEYRGAAALALAQARLAEDGDDPGAIARAWQHAASILEKAPPDRHTLALALGLGAWLLRNGRPARAEALLRAVGAAAEIAAGPGHGTESRLLLAECLCWSGRWSEASEAIAEEPCARAESLRVWIGLAMGDLAGALARAARLCAAAETPADRVAGLFARARCDAWVGDAARADAALVEAAGLLHGSSLLIRRELALFRLECAVRAGAPEMPARAVSEARRVAARGWPRLLRCRARTALVLASRPEAPARHRLERQVRLFVLETGAAALLPDAAHGWPWPALPDGRTAMLQDVLEVLQACQRDDPPASALGAVARLVRDRTRAAGVAVLGVGPDDRLRILGSAGRAPGEEVARRAVDLGLPVAPVRSEETVEAACPISYASARVGVLACRWHTDPNGGGAPLMALLETVATAVAPTVRLALELLAPPAAPNSQAGELLLGGSDRMLTVKKTVAAAARAPFPVLIEGESGSGKELVARAIHRGSPRRARAFCAINCAAFSDELLEAELFGHARGAFTGAVAERAGLFEEADGGTLFLDEVSELSPRAQAKLLRVLQEGEIRRLGETRPRRVDVRIVAASNRSIRDLVEAGRFRHDLRYRLDVIRVEVPPLRARPEDIPLLVRHYWQRAAARVGSQAVLAPETCAALVAYGWPGNVRELQNVLAALAVAAPRAGRLGPELLPSPIGPPAAPVLPLDEARRRFESGYVRDVLARTGGNRTRAALALGVTRQGLAKLIDRLGVGEGRVAE